MMLVACYAADDVDCVDGDESDTNEDVDDDFESIHEGVDEKMGGKSEVGVDSLKMQATIEVHVQIY